MKRLKNIATRFWKEESGQTTTEYILIVAVVILIALKLKDKLGSTLSGILNTASDKSGTIWQDFN